MIMESAVELGAWQHWHSSEHPIRLGASACLLGDAVRYDGSHVRDRFLADRLGAWFEFVRVCPEVEVGMGTPRPTVRIDESDGERRLIESRSGKDWSEPMRAFSERRVAALLESGLDGYVLKKGSPSCGMERIKTYRGAGSVKQGAGLFAQVLMERAPELPVEEEGRLNDARLRENFIERVFCANRLRALCSGEPDRGRLVRFHTAHKLLLLAHDEAAYRRMGRLVGGTAALGEEQVLERYRAEFHSALKRKATRKSHTNVLQHAMGHLKRALGAADKRRLLTAIDDYRSGLIPLVVPLTLLHYEIERHAIDYLKGQLYFDPHPKELMLRNHV